MANSSLSRKDVVLQIISDSLSVPLESINMKSVPSDFTEWDSLANMQIFVLLAEKYSNLDFDLYYSCANIGELINLIEE